MSAWSGSYLKDKMSIAGNAFSCRERLACLWLSIKVLCTELIIIACLSILCFMWKYKNIDLQIQLNF